LIVKDKKNTKARAPSKTYTKEDRIKNLELARERKKNIESKQKKKEQINLKLNLNQIY
jgi:hypothetical protein